MFAASPFLIANAPLRSDDGARAEDLLLPPAVGVDVPALGDRLRHRERAISVPRLAAPGSARVCAAAELTVLFGAIALVTGPLWARKAWGVWWQWDVRLTASLMGWMVAWAYLLVRKYGGPGSDKLAAGLALFGMANVPFVYISVNYWRTIHPTTSVVPTLPVDMGAALWFAVCLLPAALRVAASTARAPRGAAREARLAVPLIG